MNVGLNVCNYCLGVVARACLYVCSGHACACMRSCMRIPAICMCLHACVYAHSGVRFDSSSAGAGLRVSTCRDGGHVGRRGGAMLPATLRSTLLSDRPRRGLIARFSHIVGLDDVVANRELLKATLRVYAGKVPGRYVLASAVVGIDRRCGGSK